MTLMQISIKKHYDKAILGCYALSRNMIWVHLTIIHIIKHHLESWTDRGQDSNEVWSSFSPNPIEKDLKKGKFTYLR